MTSVGTGKTSIAAFFLLFVFAVSLPPKWATLHLAGLLLVVMTGFARRADWYSTAAQTFLLCTVLWLVPVLFSAGLQHALGVATAPAWQELPILTLRMLGIGLGLIILIERGWLTLRSAVLALLCALLLHVGAGLYDWLATPGADLESLRQIRIDGLAGNPNPFGTFVALAAIVAAGILRGQARNPMLWVLLIAALFCVVVSGSRGAILTTAAGLAFLFPPDNRARLLLYVVGAALAVSVYLLVGQSPGFVSSDNERLQAFTFSLEKIRQAPWLGWGIDAYERLPGLVGPKAPHNMWLDLAVSSGLVALAGAMLSTVLLAYRLFRCGQPAARLALAVLAATVVAGTLEYSILISTHFRGIWVTVTALACCTLAACSDRPNRSTP